MGVEFAGEPTSSERYVAANGLRFHYLEWGRKESPPVVLLHGFAQTCHSWDFVALGLCDRFRLIAVDLRGHGDSDWAPDGDYSLEAHQRDLQALVEALRLDRVVLMGNSMGGRVSLLHGAARAEQVTGVVMVDAAPEHVPVGVDKIRRFLEQPDVLDSFEEFVGLVQRYNHRRPVEQIRGSLIHNLRQLADGRWTWKYDAALRSGQRSPINSREPVARLWEAVDEVRCPALLVRGAESDIVSQAILDKMRQRNPTFEQVTVEGAGHLVVGDNPAGFQKAVSPFLDSLE